MIVGKLIFDWGKAESLHRDKIASIGIVALASLLLYASFEIRLPNPLKDDVKAASVMQFHEEDLAKEWSIKADEGGPFPGGMAFDTETNFIDLDNIVTKNLWTPNQAKLKAFKIRKSETNSSSHELQEFPDFRDKQASNEIIEPQAYRQIPILKVFDPKALAWLTKEIPEFKIPETKETQKDALRFMLQLRKDGAVADVTPTSGGTNPLQDSLITWLATIPFQKADEPRWLVLDVEFINQTNDESDSE
jgi:hypothetical protein